MNVPETTLPLPELSGEKVLFQDIDGVLNSRQFFIDTRDRFKAICGPEEYYLMYDERAVKRMNRVYAETGCVVVISSSWRVVHPLARILHIFKTVGLNADVVDVTPYLRFQDGKRGDEIKMWLEYKAHVPVDAYAIVDDDSDMLPEQRSHFVQTTNQHGLQDEHVDRLIEILGKKP